MTTRTGQLSKLSDASRAVIIGVSHGMSLSSSTAHLPTLASPLSLGADGGCSLPPRIVVTGGTWGLQLALAEHPAHMSSLGVHGGTAYITPATMSVVVHCVALWWRGHSTTPLSWLGSHVACNSHWQRASWRWHRHGCHQGHLHCHHGLGHTQLTAWVGSPSNRVIVGITCGAPLSSGGRRGRYYQDHTWPT